MKVRMKTLMAGPDGVLQPGQVVDLPVEQAETLIAGGFAVAVEVAQKLESPPVAVEGAPEPEKPQIVEDEAAPKQAATRRSRK